MESEWVKRKKALGRGLCVVLISLANSVISPHTLAVTSTVPSKATTCPQSLHTWCNEVLTITYKDSRVWKVEQLESTSLQSESQIQGRSIEMTMFSCLVPGVQYYCTLFIKLWVKISNTMEKKLLQWKYSDFLTYWHTVLNSDNRNGLVHSQKLATLPLAHQSRRSLQKAGWIQ